MALDTVWNDEAASTVKGVFQSHCTAAMDGYHAVNGAQMVNGVSRRQPVLPGNKLRVPTVHEALPYTPLSSIVPFAPGTCVHIAQDLLITRIPTYSILDFIEAYPNMKPSDIIPAPMALPTTTSSSVISSESTKSAKNLLNQISSGATNAETASKRCQQTLRDVQKLLDPDSLTQFKFKKRKQLHSAKDSSRNVQIKTPALSPFAKMVFDNTRVSYRYLTPESPEPEVERDSKHASNGATSGAQAKAVECEANGTYVTPQHEPPTSSQQRTLEAIIPSTLTPSQRAQYQYMSDPSPSQRQGITATGGSKSINIDQRHKGDQAVQNLENLFSEVFEAEDQLQPGTSALGPEQTSSIFAQHDGFESEPRLQPDLQYRLDSYIYKVVSAGRLQDIDVENLMRIQRLCQVPVVTVEKLPLRIEEQWTEDDESDWLQRLGDAEIGLIASRSLMRIMSGGAHLKELQSEDFLRRTLEALKAVIEGCLIPIVEEPPLAGERIR